MSHRAANHDQIAGGHLLQQNSTKEGDHAVGIGLQTFPEMWTPFIDDDQLLGRDLKNVRGLCDYLVGGQETIAEPVGSHAAQVEGTRPQMLRERNYRHKLSPRQSIPVLS